MRVAQDVVRLADEFFFFPATGFDEGQVDAGDKALGVGAREDHHGVGEVELRVGHIYAAFVAVVVGEVIGFGLAGRFFHIGYGIHGFPLFWKGFLGYSRHGRTRRLSLLKHVLCHVGRGVIAGKTPAAGRPGL